MTLNRVVLPAPFGPISPVTEPGPTVRLTSDRAATPPKRTATPVTSRMGPGASTTGSTDTLPLPHHAGVDRQGGHRTGGRQQPVARRCPRQPEPGGDPVEAEDAVGGPAHQHDA